MRCCAFPRHLFVVAYLSTTERQGRGFAETAARPSLVLFSVGAAHRLREGPRSGRMYAGAANKLTQIKASDYRKHQFVTGITKRMTRLWFTDWATMRAGMMASRLNHREHVIPALTDH